LEHLVVTGPRGFTLDARGVDAWTIQSKTICAHRFVSRTFHLANR